MNPDYVPDPTITFQPDTALFWILCSMAGYLGGAIVARSGIVSVGLGWGVLAIGWFVVDEITVALLLVFACQGLGGGLAWLIFRR